MRVFPKAIVLITKSHFDVKTTYASIRGLVVKTIALGKTRISAILANSGRHFHLLSSLPVPYMSVTCSRTYITGIQQQLGVQSVTYISGQRKKIKLKYFINKALGRKSIK